MMNNERVSEMTERNYISIAESVLEERDLMHGNSEVVEQGDELFVVFEAPNNSTMTTVVDVQELEQCADEDEVRAVIMNEVRRIAHSFDADDQFELFYSKEFMEHNGFTVSQFIEMLKEDEEFFHNL